MAWDISDYKLENLGPDPLDPGIDWDAIARMIAEKEEAAKETAESEKIIEAPPKPVDTMAEMAPSLSDQLRRIADQIEAL
ncbi:MAG: hypothetical protein CL489_15615 [Acidobacteria bacterium]|nr:hypothetical protein [Acidobacteriota bacterium]